MNKKINVLSLFDGISCGRVALERAGFNVGVYYASEIDKYATQVSEKNYSDIIRVGDVTKWKDWDINWKEIDLVMAGSPCQGFSFAGKQLAFNDPRSVLFFEFVNILNHIKKYNPDVKFLLENVKMKQQYMDVITGLLEENPLLINSSLVSAQNRQRLYWANWDFTTPSDQGILLESIFEDDDCVMDKYYLTRKNLQHMQRKFGSKGKDITDLLKCNTLTASMGTGGGNHSDMDLILKDFSVRRLTPLECERLQTIPDNYTSGVSDTQRYKALGNGWTVDVIAHIFKGLKK
jgi:DNA-cytosine methyltransferase